ncbi:hypothetical protein [Phenylobacterium sp.]|uniref:hypothetical protein n=1 Tax=Phenylobacterium sp. TaxID=1871053 RepID=UPI003569BBD5
MTIDFSATPDNGPTSTETESSMFAPIPSWERGKKRRGLSRAFGGGRTTRVAEEPRSFVAEPDRSLETGVLAGDQRAYAFDPIAPTNAAMAEAEPAFAGTPSYANVSARRKSNAAPVAIAAGIVLLGGLAATGWYMTQNHTVGVAQLTPGAVTTTTTTAAGDEVQTAQNLTPQAALPAASESASAPTAAAPAATHVTTTTTTHSAAPASATHKTTTTVARARPARSAGEASADVSATAPAQAAPAPVQAAPTPTPAAPLVLTIPAAPAQAAPVQTAPAPTETPPQ